MKHFNIYLWLLVAILALQACDDEGAAVELSSDTQLSRVDFLVGTSIYTTAISGTEVSLSTPLPFGTSKVAINVLDLPQGASANLKIGEVLSLSQSPFSLVITAENGESKTYSLNIETEPPSSEAALLALTIEVEGKEYVASIENNRAVIPQEFAFNSSPPAIKHVEVSAEASANVSAGASFNFDEEFAVEITAQDGTVNTYTVLAHKDVDGEMLINQATLSNCGDFAQITLGDMLMENNIWNAGSLEPGSFSQCIYQYETAETSMFGWEWAFPDDAPGVNAYPEIIYGKKPWMPNSTNDILPKPINEINSFKVDYEVESYIGEGDYNLAFDIWLTASEAATVEGIQFEFMIWEDWQALRPFGDYQADVSTSNGVYELYVGQPTWAHWTYIAFVRKNSRTGGQVDVDELLNYLVAEGIVPSTSYFATLEFGNEVGNSQGYTVVKQFEVGVD